MSQQSQLARHLDYLQNVPAENNGTPLSLIATVADLPQFLRALLVADGTVTLLLAAYFDEPIKIQMKHQMLLRLPSDLPHLGVITDQEIFYRRVSLIGSASDTTYADAVSLINPETMAKPLFEELIDEEVGMGEVLRNSARGSYRELLDVRVDDDDIVRTYIVYLDGRRSILITERFHRAAFSVSRSQSSRR